MKADMTGRSALSKKLSDDPDNLDSRIIKSVRGSTSVDMMLPVTNEHKMYLAGIDEEEETDENNNSKGS